MAYKNAFKCQRCPKSSNDDGCPAWAEFIQQHIETGEQAVKKDCVFQLLPWLMVEVIRAANQPAEEISAMRGEMVEATEGVVRELAAKVVPQLLSRGKFLEQGN